MGCMCNFTGSSVGLTIPWRDVERFEDALKEFTAFEVIQFWYRLAVIGGWRARFY